MPTLPPEWIAHFASGVSHRIGSVSAGGRPAICRGLAAQCDPQGQVGVFATRTTSAAVLDAVAETGWVSLVMAGPQTHRTLHLKGRDARVEAAGNAFDALVAARRDAFAAQIAPYGFTPDQVLKSWYHFDPGDLFVIRFSIVGAWDQTPGPGAGNPIELLP
jgi:hypothetical protein